MSVESVIVLGDGSVSEITICDARDVTELDLRINAESLHAVPDIKVLVSTEEEVALRESKFLDSIREPEEVIDELPFWPPFYDWIPAPVPSDPTRWYRIRNGKTWPGDPTLGAALAGFDQFGNEEALICHCNDGLSNQGFPNGAMNALPASQWFRGGSFLQFESREGDHSLMFQSMQKRLRAYGRFFLKTNNGKVYFRVLNPYAGRANVTLVVDWDVTKRHDKPEG